MKIVVIGDIVVPCELLVEAAKHLDSHAEVVAVEWPNASRQEFQHRAQNLEKNGPTAEKVPGEAYEQVDLFDAAAAPQKERQEKLEAAMDRIRGKYGAGAISFGAAHTEKEEDPLP